MLSDKIKNILATETSDMLKINKLSNALEKLFIDELIEIANLAAKRLDDDSDTS